MHFWVSVYWCIYIYLMCARYLYLNTIKIRSFLTWTDTVSPSLSKCFSSIFITNASILTFISNIGRERYSSHILNLINSNLLFRQSFIGDFNAIEGNIYKFYRFDFKTSRDFKRGHSNLLIRTKQHTDQNKQVFVRCEKPRGI